MEALYKKHILITLSLSIILILGCVGLWQFGLRMKDKHDKVREVKEELATYNQNKKVYAEESVQLREIASRVASIETKRIRTSTIPELLSTLEAIAATYNLTYTISAVQTPKTEEEEKLAVSMIAKGTMPHIMDFLGTILSQPYQAKITKLTIYKEQPPAEAPLPPEQLWNMQATVDILSFSK
jgi:hypothetical protein